MQQKSKVVYSTNSGEMWHRGKAYTIRILLRAKLGRDWLTSGWYMRPHTQHLVKLFALHVARSMHSDHCEIWHEKNTSHCS